MKKRKISTLLLTMVMTLTMIFPSSQVFANVEDASGNGTEDIIYSVSSNLSEDKQTTEIVLTLTPKEDIQIESVVLPDGTIEENLNTTVTYFVQENGIYSFYVNYVNTLLEDSLEENQTKTIDYNVSDIEVVEYKEDEIDTEKESMEEISEIKNTETIFKSIEKNTMDLNTKTLDLADGKIIIEEDGYYRSYQGVPGEKVLFTGDYIIQGTYNWLNWDGDVVEVTGGTEDDPIKITLSDAVIDITDDTNVISKAAAFIIGDTIAPFNKEGHVNLILEGNNVLRGSSMGAGIELFSSSEKLFTKSTLVIGGSGSLEATGGTGASGIGASRSKVNNIDYKVTINSGVINATGGIYGAGIGGGQSTNGGEIIINGGTITSIGGTNAAGIGGGTIQGTYYEGLSDMSITINGGLIIAKGGSYGAGIGTARFDTTLSTATLEEHYITINIKEAAEVTATGGTGSAGIGQGYFYNKDSNNPFQNSSWIIDSINISGGNVKAQGTGSSAGIGTSQTASVVKNINISNGIVDATGGYLGAGIGTGYTGTFESITISGGRVNATAGNYASGIGTGNLGIGGDIMIQGGVIDAKSVQVDTSKSGQGSGIGSGYRSSINSLTIGKDSNVTATGSPFGSGIGRSYDDTGTTDKIFPIIIEKGAKVTAYALGDFYSELLAVGDVIPDAPYMSAIDQECIAHVGSDIASYMLMGDFKQIPNENAEQEVTINNVTTRIGTSVTLPAGYASFATTVSDGLHRVEMNGARYAGDLVKRTEDNLVNLMGGNEKTLHAYWMLQPKTIEYTVDFKYVSTVNPESVVIPTPVVVAEGDQVSEPVITVPTDWTFDGWYLDEACTQKFIFTTKVTGNITLHGKWQYNAPVIPTPTATPTVAPTVAPTATPNVGRSCQDDGYPDGYYWSESAQACVIDKVIVVPTVKPTIKPTSKPIVEPTIETDFENSVDSEEKSNEQKPTAATIVDSNATNQDGNDKMEIDAKGSWSLVTVLASLGTLILAIILIVIKKEDEENENEKIVLYKRNKGMMWGAIGLSVLGVIIVFLTQSFTQPMVWFDGYSLVMILIMIINSCLLYFGTQWKEIE